MTPMPVLRIDRLEQLTAELEAGIVDLDVWRALPVAWAAPLKLLKQLGRLDLPDRAKTEVLTSLRALPSAARSDPARADRAAAWLVHVIAWLTGQTEIPPPPPPDDLLRAAPRPASDEATGSPSSARPDLVSQPSSDNS